MFWEDEYIIEDIGEEKEDVLVTIEYIEDKNVQEIEDINYLNDFVSKLTLNGQSANQEY